jgi:hypothetical protein
MTWYQAPGDGIKIRADDASLLDDDTGEYEPVTSGLVGTAAIYDWETDVLVDGPDPLVQAGTTDDWYANMFAPALHGQYRIKFVVDVGGSPRTKHGKLVVADPST